MKTKPFQFRYVNEIVGVFVLLVVALLVAAVVLAGRAQGWFEPVHRLHIDFPPEGSLNLQQGSPVQILGATVGGVESIIADEDGFMTAIITVKGDFFQYVRTDSRVIVKKKFGVAGDAYIDITKGTGPALPHGAGLVATKDIDLVVLVQNLVTQVSDAVLPLIESVRKAVDETAGLLGDVRSVDMPVQKLLSNIESITARINRGEGPAGRIVSDEEMAKQIDALVAQVREAMAQLQAILADVQKTAAELPPMAKTVGGEVQSIPGTVALTQETIRETEKLIEGLQRHWLLRKYIPQPASTPLIPVYDIPKPVKAGDPGPAATKEAGR